MKCAWQSEELEREVAAPVMVMRAVSVKIAEYLKLHCGRIEEVKVLEVHLCSNLLLQEDIKS